MDVEYKTVIYRSCELNNHGHSIKETENVFVGAVISVPEESLHFTV